MKKKITALIIGVIMLIAYLYMMNIYSQSTRGDSQFLMIFFSLIIALPIVAMLIHWYNDSLLKDKRTYENFDYEKYKFGSHRKKIK